MKPLEEAERRLAEVTARVIAKAQEIGLPDAPDKLVTPHAIQFLARAYLELLDRISSQYRQTPSTTYVPACSVRHAKDEA